MSSAFIKEDVEIVERPMLRRSPTGLPPGTLNLMTAQGSQQLRDRIRELSAALPDAPEIERLQDILHSATIVTPVTTLNSIVFGSTVSLKNAQGDKAVYRIVGVDEVGFASHNVSWVSYIGKTLLSAGGLDQRISLAPNEKAKWTVVSVQQ
jgi:transcription elongation GreA/GreB family factor